MDLPRERLLHKGANALSNAEIISIILKSGVENTSVFDIALTISKLQDPTYNELKQIKGIGHAKACQILALFEFGKRYTTKPISQTYVKNAKGLYELFRQVFAESIQEEFVVLYLSAQLQILGYDTLFKGTLDSVLVHPREIFFKAIKNLAHSIIVLHNHPSGDPTPSLEDEKITEKLKVTGEVISIPMIDHIIIGRNSYWSWAEHS